jgi:hypothetical protein
MVFQGLHILEADDGGIYRLRNPGVAGRTWESFNHDLILTELYDVAYDGVNDRILGGNQDTGVGHQSATNSVIWNSLLQADGAFVDVSGTTHYFNNQFLGSFGPAPALVNAAGPGSGAAANNILIVPLGSPIQVGDQLNLPERPSSTMSWLSRRWGGTCKSPSPITSPACIPPVSLCWWICCRPAPSQARTVSR